MIAIVVKLADFPKASRAKWQSVGPVAFDRFRL
jgi:hypothetical protein